MSKIKFKDILTEGNLSRAYDDMEKWMPDNSEDQQEFYNFVDDKDISGLADFIDMVADEEVLGRFIKGNEVKKLAKYIIMNEGKLNEGRNDKLTYTWGHINRALMSLRMPNKQILMVLSALKKTHESVSEGKLNEMA